MTEPLNSFEMEAPPIKSRNRRYSHRSWGCLCLVVIIASVVGSTLLVVANWSQFQSQEESGNSSVVSENEVSKDYLTNTDPGQRTLIQEFREAIQDNFTQEYMRKESYLVPWLIEANWDLEYAIESFMTHLEWREEYEMDGILNRTFENLPVDLNIDGFDKEGRPVISGSVSQWDIRKISVSGKGKPFLQYVFQKFEMAAKLIRDAQSNGKNVTQMVIIFDLDGFNLIQNGCFTCIKYYVRAINGLDDNYPLILYKLLLINTPEEFDFFFSLIPEKFERVMESYGSNKALWKPVVLKLIAPDQIRTQFGGTIGTLE